MAGIGQGGGMAALSNVMGEMGAQKRAEDATVREQNRIEAAERRHEASLASQENRISIKHALELEKMDQREQREDAHITKLMMSMATIKGKKYQREMAKAPTDPKERQLYMDSLEDETTADMQRLFEKNPKYGAIGLALTHEAMQAYGSALPAGEVAVDADGNPIEGAAAGSGEARMDSIGRDMGAGLTKRNPDLARSMSIMARQKSEGKVTPDREAQMMQIINALQTSSDREDSLGNKTRGFFDKVGEIGGKGAGFLSGIIGGGQNDLAEGDEDTRADTGVEEGVKKGILSGRKTKKKVSKGLMNFLKDFTGKE